MGKSFIDTTENCRYCLMCRHIAPVGHVMANETVTPHGIALTVASERRGLIEWNEETAAIMYAEPDGGNCRAHCVTDQPLPAAIAEVRASLVKKKLMPAAVKEAASALKTHGTPYGSRKQATGKTKSPVALFAGDEATYLRPAALKAVDALLKKAGVKSTRVGRGQNSGLLAQSLGYPKIAAKLFDGLISEVKKTDAELLLTIGPGNYSAVTDLLPERLGKRLPKGVKVREVSCRLAEAVRNGDLKFRKFRSKKPFAYVDPSHAVRVPGRFDRVRSLVAACVSGDQVDLFWRRERAHPVGSTGIEFGRPDIAERLTRARLEDAQNSGAGMLICEDPATLHHLDRYANEYGITIMGLYELMADRLK